MPNQQPNLNQQFNQPSPPISSPPQKPKFNLKYILIVLVLAVAVVGILIWQYPMIIIPVEQPIIKNETANWHTYRNAELGIEFKYPKSWGEAVESRFQGPTECQIGNRILSGTQIRFSFSENSDITLYLNSPDYKAAICYVDREEILPGFSKEEDLSCEPYPIGISQAFECNRSSIANSPAISWYDAIDDVQACGYIMDKHIKVISPNQNFPGVEIIAFISAGGYDTGCYENGELRQGPNITLEDFMNIRLKQLKENQLPSEAQQFLREFDNFITSIKFIK